jgi:RecA-family ATPase
VAFVPEPARDRNLNGHPESNDGDLKTVTMDALLRREAPKREWHVERWIPANNVTLFPGDGGTGKTTIAMQLGWAAASSRQWLGMAVKPCSVLYVSCEEETSELHYRGQQFYTHEIAATGLERFHLLDLAGQDDTLLVTFKGDKPQPTPLFQKIETFVARHKTGLLILDSVADVFGGDENSRPQVRAFIRILRGLALRRSCTIPLLAHPSVSGMQSGRNYSGTTQWNNSVRSRLSLTMATTEDGEEPDPDLRILELLKANRARAGEKIYIRWKDGRFIRDSRAADGVDIEQELKDEELFLKLLDKFGEEGRNACLATGTSYAPKRFAEHPLGKKVSPVRFKHAMEILLSAGKIKNETYGSGDRQRSKLVRVL